jgi:hypothetical protein
VALNTMNSTVIDDPACLGPPDDRYNAVLVCAFSGTNAPCHGDSGAALILTTPTPVAVGVTGSGSSGCGANTVALFADLTAPEVLRFVQGDDAPPTAPRPTASPALALSTPIPQVGQTIRCVPGGWTNEPTLAYSFREATNDVVLREGVSAYPLRIGDAGRAVRCRVAATNPGGTSTADSPDSPAVLSEPELSVSPGGARPGGVALVRVAFVRWAQPIGSATVCTASSPRVGTRVCHTRRLAAGTRPTVTVRFPVRRAAPAARTRVTVTARSTDGRSATGSTTLRIG